MREHGWFLSTHVSSADKYLASAFDVILSPAGKGKWSPVAGFVNYFEHSGARRVSLLCCIAVNGVSVGGLLPVLCPHCSNVAGASPQRGISLRPGFGCAAGSPSARLLSVLGFPSAVLVLGILLMNPSICFEHSSEHFPERL